MDPKIMLTLTATITNLVEANSNIGSKSPLSSQAITGVTIATVIGLLICCCMIFFVSVAQ